MAKQSYIYGGSGWEPLAAVSTDLTNYANMTTTPISGFRNAIINGDFRINQRGITSSGTTTSGYFLDRWRMDGSTGTITASVQSFTPGNSISGYEPTQHSRIAVTGQSLTTAYASTSQKIEDVRTFAGQTIVISFWAKAASGTPKVGIELTQDFGVGGSTAVITFAGNATISTSWQRYSISLTVPGISGKTIGTDSELQIGIWVSAGSTYDSRSGSIGIQNNTFDFWGVQVEKGSIATPFEQRPIGIELALCQRYYYRTSSNTTGNSQLLGNGWCTSTTSAFVQIKFPVTMRTRPTAIETTATASNYGVYNTVGSGVGITSLPSYNANTTNEYGAIGLVVASGLTSGSGTALYTNASSSAYLGWSAEL